MEKKLRLKTETVLELEEKASILEEQLREAKQQIKESSELELQRKTSNGTAGKYFNNDMEHMYKLMVDNLTQQVNDQRA